MAVYSIKNISASAVVWSSQTIQPNEAIDINYENLYDKTTDLGISQDAINVSTLAQEDKILLCIDDVASTKAETLEFIRELHNKNNVLEIPTKFLPSKHLYNWEKVGTKLSYLGDVDVDGNLAIDKDGNKKISGGFGAISTSGTLDWNDSTNSKSGQGLTLLRYTASNAPLLDGVGYWHPFTYEYSKNNGTGNRTQFAIPYGITAKVGNMSYRSFYNTAWTGWREILSSKEGTRIYNLGTTTNSSPSNGDLWNNGTELLFGDKKIVTESPYFTDGWVSVPSSWIHSGITVTESFQYRVNEVGTIEFSGRGQNNTNTSSRAFTIFNANAIPTALRPSKLQRGALACEVGGVTRTNYYYMATTGQLSIYKDVTASGGTFSANECKVSITTLNYQIQG